MMNKYVLASLALSTSLLCAGPAMADQKCKSVDLEVTNEYGKQIKVLKVNYRDKDDKKWRDNDLSNTTISDNVTKTIDEDLEYVGNETIPKMQVQFRYKEQDGDWSDRVWSNVTTGLGGANCVKNKDYEITVSSIGSKQ